MTEVRTLDLGNPEHAREYIREFKVKGKKPTYVDLSSGQRVEFKTMDDADAVIVAHCLYDMEVEAERRVAQKAGQIQ